MDRLPALIGGAAALALATLLAGCGGRAQGPGPARTDRVTAPAQASAGGEEWCDAYYPEDRAPALSLPKVVPARPGEALPAVPGDRWVWVNLWATWCEPCRREMPLLVQWHRALVKDGIPLDLLFVSVDEREQDLVTVLKANPAMAPGASGRLATFSEVDRGVASFKGAPTGTIPLQIIAAPGGRVRCIRAGSLREGDLALVKQLFGK